MTETETNERRRAEFLRAAAKAIRSEWKAERGSGWSQVQAYHLAMADWLDGEAATQLGMEPLVELFNAAYENKSGVIGYLKFQRDETGQINYASDTSPSALRLAAAYLGRPEPESIAGATQDPA